MGLCMSAQGGTKTNTETVSEYNIKVVLLGGGGVGKSTLFKQLSLLYGSGFSDEYRQQAKGEIYDNMLQLLTELGDHSVTLDIDMEDDNEEIPDAVQEVFASFHGRNTNEPVPKLGAELWADIKKMWYDSGIVKTLQSLNDKSNAAAQKLKYLRSAVSFFDDIERLADESHYLPNDADILKLRRPTEKEATMNYSARIINKQKRLVQYNVECVDVGGQSHAQANWGKYCQGAQTIVYMCSISSYDDYLHTEGSDQNELRNQIQLFEKVTQSEWFQNANIIIMLNKCDLFQQKIRTVDFKNYFPGFKGKPRMPSAACAYVEEILLSKVQSTQSVACFRTCATDRKLMEKMLLTVTQNIADHNLKAAGMKT